MHGGVGIIPHPRVVGRRFGGARQDGYPRKENAKEEDDGQLLGFDQNIQANLAEVIFYHMIELESTTKLSR